MIDGVEENDVWLNWAYLSRQYPISNIKAIELFTGPPEPCMAQELLLVRSTSLHFLGERAGDFFKQRENRNSDFMPI